MNIAALAKAEKENKRTEKADLGKKKKRNVSDSVPQKECQDNELAGPSGIERPKKRKKQKKSVVKEDDDESEDVDDDLEYKEISSGEETFSDLEEENNEVQTMDENVKREPNEFVIFSYEGELFPGQIIQVNPDGAMIKSMQRCGASWKWPDHPDIMFYVWSDVKGCIKPIKVSSRREIFKIPELVEKWT